MKGADDELRLDGNAAAGLLAELFAFEVTTAATTCDGCGRTSPLGALHLYCREMGAVLRCPLCSGLMMVVTRLDGVTRIDLRGVRVLRVIRPGMAVAFQTGE
jgi:Family of unknown function (DUF6510)